MHMDSLFIGLKLHNERSDIYVVILDLDAFAVRAQFFYFCKYFGFSSCFFLLWIPFHFVIQLAKEI